MDRTYELKDPPTNTISSAKFHKTLDELLDVSTWDSTVRLYDVVTNNLKLTWTHPKPVFDCSFVESDRLISGGISNHLISCNAATNVIENLGSREDPINCVEDATKINAVLSGSSGKTIKLWDLRLKGCVGTYEQSQGKVVALNVVNNKISVGTTDQNVLVWDLRMMKQYLIRHVLNHQPRTIKLSPDSQCYVIGTPDERIDINYIKRNPDPGFRRTNLKYQGMRSFYGLEKVFNANSIDFHNLYNSFASGGSDGFIKFWDYRDKSPLWQYCKYDAPIEAVNFSADGQKLAAANSHHVYYWDHPYKMHPPKIKVSRVGVEYVRAYGGKADENADVDAGSSTSGSGNGSSSASAYETLSTRVCTCTSRSVCPRDDDDAKED